MRDYSNYHKFCWAHRRSYLASKRGDKYAASWWYYVCMTYLCRHLGEPDDWFERLVRWKRSGYKGLPEYDNQIGK